jgi:hypothetical protein
VRVGHEFIKDFVTLAANDVVFPIFGTEIDQRLHAVAAKFAGQHIWL